MRPPNEPEHVMLFPATLQDLLPVDHPAHFVYNRVDTLKREKIDAPFGGSGSSCHPLPFVCLASTPGGIACTHKIPNAPIDTSKYLLDLDDRSWL